jgi:hypothetical protein
MGGNFTPELKRLLREAGCRFERPAAATTRSGPITGVRFPVDHKIKSRHTANAVLRQAGLPKAF